MTRRERPNRPWLRLRLAGGARVWPGAATPDGVMVATSQPGARTIGTVFARWTSDVRAADGWA